jgi:hypothetical protein
MPRHTTLSALLGLIITATPFGSQANDAFGVQPTLSIDTIATFAEQAPSMDDASPEQTIFDERLRAMHVIPASLEASYPDLYCHEVALNTAEACLTQNLEAMSNLRIYYKKRVESTIDIHAGTPDTRDLSLKAVNSRTTWEEQPLCTMSQPGALGLRNMILCHTQYIEQSESKLQDHVMTLVQEKADLETEAKELKYDNTNLENALAQAKTNSTQAYIGHQKKLIKCAQEKIALQSQLNMCKSKQSVAQMALCPLPRGVYMAMCLLSTNPCCGAL